MSTLPPLRNEQELREAIALMLTAPAPVRNTANFTAIRDHVIGWADTHGHGGMIPPDLRPPQFSNTPRDDQGRFTSLSDVRRRELLTLSGYPEPPQATDPPPKAPAPASPAFFSADGVGLYGTALPPVTPDGQEMSDVRRKYLLSLSGLAPATQ
jgi:hypothetical protein